MNSSSPPSSKTAGKHVPAGLFWRSALFDSTSRAWRWLAGLESGVLRDEIDATTISKPVYVAGLARSGTTIITELLARHPDVTSHRYSDFPNVYTPYWRNWLAQRTGAAPTKAVERAHQDRLMVTTESPEAVEEVLWMQFFEHSHDPSMSHVLDRSTSNPAFEAFYRDHIRKLLLVRGRSRYLAKGNYNTTRLGYLLKLFPDARFIVPVRNPVNHVASLVKQDRLFERLADEDPRVPAHLHRSGHFEFGPDKRCVNAGDSEAIRAIQEYWSVGKPAHGWAMCWDSVYRGVLKQLESNPGLKQAVLFVRYEDLCRLPDQTISGIVRHAGLSEDSFKPVKQEYVDKLQEPDYYEPGFSGPELQAIEALTGSTGKHFGYCSG